MKKIECCDFPASTAVHCDFNNVVLEVRRSVGAPHGVVVGIYGDSRYSQRREQINAWIDPASALAFANAIYDALGKEVPAC